MGKHGPKTRKSKEDRFWEKVLIAEPDECWFWQAQILAANGYGVFDGTTAHRVAWELRYGAIPVGIQVLHSCDERYAKDDITYRKCVNPTHLWLGTHQDNMDDMRAKGRELSGARLCAIRKAAVPKGEASYQSVLTSKEVIAIRAAYQQDSSRGRQTALANQYGVTQGAINGIVSRRTWKSVE